MTRDIKDDILRQNTAGRRPKRTISEETSNCEKIRERKNEGAKERKRKKGGGEEGEGMGEKGGSG